MPGEVPLRLEEGGRAGELTDREGGNRFGLMRRTLRLVALHRVKVVDVVRSYQQGGRHRADDEQQDGAEPDPETNAHTHILDQDRL